MRPNGLENFYFLPTFSSSSSFTSLICFLQNSGVEVSFSVLKFLFMYYKFQNLKAKHYAISIERTVEKSRQFLLAAQLTKHSSKKRNKQRKKLKKKRFPGFGHYLWYALNFTYLHILKFSMENQSTKFLKKRACNSAIPNFYSNI